MKDFELEEIYCVDLLSHALGRREAFLEVKNQLSGEGTLNITYLALNLSHYINGVAKRHGEVSRHMFGKYNIDSITNGVHAPTWASQPFATLFDRHIPGWRQDSFSLRYALSIPDQEVWLAHLEAKRMLLSRVNREMHVAMDEHLLTIGFGRRAATYKRADLVFYEFWDASERSADGRGAAAHLCG